MDSHYKPRDTDCAVQSRNEAYKNSAKIIQKFTVKAGEAAIAQSPPPLNTPLNSRPRSSCIAVEDLVLSKKDKPKTYRSAP